MASLEALAAHVPVVFPVHPRTRARLEACEIPCGRTRLIEPLTYLPFLSLERHASAVITDSGGVQERPPTSAYRA